jgi:sugar lactone lactonase YvrE
MKKTLAAALALLFSTAAVGAHAQGLTAVPLPAEIAFPEGVAYDAKAGDIYVAGAVDGAIARVNLKTGKATVITKPGVIVPLDNKTFPSVLGIKLMAASCGSTAASPARCGWSTPRPAR